jgi:hypothetical protein
MKPIFAYGGEVRRYSWDQVNEEPMFVIAEIAAVIGSRRA